MLCFHYRNPRNPSTTKTPVRRTKMMVRANMATAARCQAIAAGIIGELAAV